MLRVVLVDDQSLIRAGLRTVLESDPGVEVVAEAGDGLGGVRAAEAHRPDVVLMDLRMPGIDGVEATRRVRALPGTPPGVLVLTTFDQDVEVLAAVRAGAAGFLGKAASPAEILAAVHRVAGGGHPLSERAVDALVTRVASGDPVPADPDLARRFADLTPREREVVAEVVRGRGNAEIAAALHLSPLTVKTHVNRAMAKVDARDRGRLVTLAVRAGFAP